MTAPLALRLPLGGAHLIEASAGTGKTWTLSSVVLRMLIEQGLRPRELVAVSFTTLASAELRERVLGLLTALADALAGSSASDAQALQLIEHLEWRAIPRAEQKRRVLAALSSFNEITITTLAGFFEQLLMQAPLSLDVPLASRLVVEDSELLEQIAADFLRREVVSTVRVRSLALSEQFTPETVAQFANPSTLAKWLGPALRDSQYADERVVRIEPKLEVAAQRFRLAYAALETCFEHASDAFDRLAIEAFVERAALAKAASRHTFRKDSIAKWLNQIQTYLSGSFSLEPPVCLGKYFSSNAEGFSDLAFMQHAPPFYEASDALCESLARLAAAGQRVEVAWRYEALRFAAQALPARLAARGERSIDVSLKSLDERLDATLCQRLAAPFKGVLIDEFQDTDMRQWAVFSKLFMRTAWSGALVLVGDPKQSIYRFRGADVLAYLNARDALPADHRHTLLDNFRSTRPLVEACNTLFRAAPDFGHESIRYHEVQASRAATDEFAVGTTPLLFAEYSPEQPAAQVCAGIVAAAIARGVKAARIAVLVDDHSQAAEVQAALRAHRVSAARVSKDPILSSPQAHEFGFVLAALEADATSSDRAAAMLTPLLGFSHEQLAAEHEGSSQLGFETFARWRSSLQRQGVPALCLQILHERRVYERLAPLVQGAQSLSNYRQLIEIMDAAQSSPRKVARALKHFESDEREMTVLRLESDLNAVQIMTVFASKGLEFDFCVLPYLASTAPKSSEGDELSVAFEGTRQFVFSPSAEQRGLAQAEAEADKRRLAYVALTRAREQVVLLWPAVPSDKSAGSAFMQILNGQTPQSLAAVSPHIAVHDSAQLVGDVEPLAAPAQPIVLRTLERSLHPAWVNTSYTQLARRLGTESLPSLGSGRDIDPVEPAAQTAPVEGAVRFEQSLPAGAHTGVVMHTALERVDWQDNASLSAQAAIAASALSADEVQMQHWLRSIGQVRVPQASGQPLAAWPRHTQHREWPFMMHLARDGVGLAQACVQMGLLDSLLPTPAGFLHGVMDLVQLIEGQFWIIDYKSNRLSGYDEAQLQQAVLGGHYGLQAAIYACALHRALTSRFVHRGAHAVGGVSFVFLRGAREPGQGVWTRRFSAAELEQLETACA